MFELTPDQIADAENAGVSFPSATPAQVQRYAMQRKVFRIGRKAVLATRDGSLFETAATLERLIAEGGRQRRDLAEWEAAVPAPGAEDLGPPRHAVETPYPPAPSAMLRAARTAKPRRALPGERWLTAGAERRGRLAQHWSRRGVGRAFVVAGRRETPDAPNAGTGSAPRCAAKRKATW